MEKNDCREKIIEMVQKIEKEEYLKYLYVLLKTLLEE